VAHRLVEQRLVYRGAEYRIVQVDLADLLVAQIHYIDFGHGRYLFLARRTTT